jgi:hypothetical protein
MFVRPCRSATIRTRLDAKAIRERISFLAGEPPPEGVDRFLSHGYWLNGWVGPTTFDIDYLYNSKHKPRFAVHGRVQETKDWRILRLKITARAPWLSALELVLLVGFTAFMVATGELPPRGAVASLALVTGIYAFANLLFIPNAVRERVSSMLATQVDGSVRVDGEWVVPR